MRQHLARSLGLVDPAAHCLLWVTDWPLFEWSEEAGRYEALHHPFTAPQPADVGPDGPGLAHARALAYDIVYNGVEIGGGSLRIYRRACGTCGALTDASSTARAHVYAETCLCICTPLLPTAQA